MVIDMTVIGECLTVRGVEGVLGVDFIKIMIAQVTLREVGVAEGGGEGGMELEDPGELLGVGEGTGNHEKFCELFGCYHRLKRLSWNLFTLLPNKDEEGLI